LWPLCGGEGDDSGSSHQAAMTMRLPITLLIIFALITVASNWDSLGQLGDNELGNADKLLIGSKLGVLTPHRTASSAYSSLTLWRETGEVGALGSAALFSSGLIFLFFFGFSVIGWLIGFVRPFKSGERKSFIAFIVTVAFFAIAIGGPLNSTIRGMGNSVLVLLRDFGVFLVANPVMIPVLIVGIIIAVIALKVCVPRIGRKVRRRRAK